jgi:hypothetical protein
VTVTAIILKRVELVLAATAVAEWGSVVRGRIYSKDCT